MKDFLTQLAGNSGTQSIVQKLVVSCILLLWLMCGWVGVFNKLCVLHAGTKTEEKFEEAWFVNVHGRLAKNLSYSIHM